MLPCVKGRDALAGCKVKEAFPKKTSLLGKWGRGIVRVQIDFDTFSKVKEVAQTGALDFDTFKREKVAQILTLLKVKKLPKLRAVGR